jgi:hypothetical protein
MLADTKYIPVLWKVGICAQILFLVFVRITFPDSNCSVDFPRVTGTPTTSTTRESNRHTTRRGNYVAGAWIPISIIYLSVVVQNKAQDPTCNKKTNRVRECHRDRSPR